jgi:hypothetical protein
MLQTYHHHPSSYRDPSGFIFEKEGVLYRQINKIFKEDFDSFISSGCYENFVKKGMLIPHEIVDENLTGTEEYYKTLKPEPVPFISYPYEWSFDMLKDAALLTLQLLKESIGFGMILKDATPYNIQWYKGRLIFIDSLSFEKYNEQEPWIAYRQFCETFLSPLLLMHYSKQPLQQLQLSYPEGIPLAVTKSLLPRRSRFSLHVWLHIHLHAKVSMQNKTNNSRQNKFSKQKLLNLILSLETLIKKLKFTGQISTWSEYYDEASQRNDYLEQKKQLINNWTTSLPGIKTAADLGANDGVFSMLLANKNMVTLACDFDPVCINNLYNEVKKNKLLFIQPLVIDISNPSPAIGVNNTERTSFISRTKVDLAMALAVIHHLVIGKNIPLDKIADLFSQLCNYLIIEFVPKEDEKIQLMLKSKKDIYMAYTENNFESAFTKYFAIEDKQAVGSSGRILYLMKGNTPIFRAHTSDV